MATLTTQSVAHAGTDITYASAAGGGDLAQTGTGIILLVKNADATSTNVTLATPGTVDGLAIADRVVAVANGVTTAIPMLESMYRDPSDNYCHVTYSKVTSLTVAVIAVS